MNGNPTILLAPHVKRNSHLNKVKNRIFFRNHAAIKEKTAVNSFVLCEIIIKLTSISLIAASTNYVSFLVICMIDILKLTQVDPCVTLNPTMNTLFAQRFS